MIKKLLFISFVVFYSTSQGQTIHVFKPNEQNQENTESQAHKDSMRTEDKNCISWNWSLLARGVVMFNYEVYLAGNLTADIGAGLTYRDYEFELTKTSLGDSSDINQYSTSGSQYGNASVSYAGEAGLKYYLSKFDNMEGPFLEVTGSYRNYSFSNSPYKEGSINTASSFTPGYSFLDGQLKFGYSASRWFSDWVSELYVGVAIRSLTANMYKTLTVQGQNQYYNYTQTNYYEGLTVKESYPQFILGFKIGLPF